jgi:hypothetical protein
MVVEVRDSYLFPVEELISGPIQVIVNGLWEAYVEILLHV